MMFNSACRSFVMIMIVSTALGGSVLGEDSDLKRMQGVWVGIVVDDEDAGEVTLTIEKDRIEFQGTDPNEWYKGLIELTEDSKPRKLLATVKDCPFEELIGKSSNGIYELEGDTLKITAAPPGSDIEPKKIGQEGCRTVGLKRKK